MFNVDLELLNKLNILCDVDNEDEEDDAEILIDENKRLKALMPKPVGTSTEPPRVSTDKKVSLLNKRGRPSVDPDADRRWACGCGKVYLTYGALYSHTRVKHGGVQPPGSVRLRDLNRKPRKDIGVSRSIRTEKGGNKRADQETCIDPWEVDLIQFLNNLVCGRDVVVCSTQ